MNGHSSLVDQLKSLDPASDHYAVAVVDGLLQAAVTYAASDLHIQSKPGHVSIRFRIQGQLIEMGCLPEGVTCSIQARVMAIARLISYRSDIPQEGRIALKSAAGPIEARVATLPLQHGQRTVIRFATAVAKQ